MLQGDVHISLMACTWPRNVLCSRPLRTSHILMLQSSEPVKMRRPERSKMQQYTGRR